MGTHTFQGQPIMECKLTQHERTSEAMGCVPVVGFLPAVGFRPRWRLSLLGIPSCLGIGLRAGWGDKRLAV